MVETDFGAIVQALKEMPRADLEELREMVSAAAFESDDQTPKGLQGSPRDTAVQKLAGAMLRMARDETYRMHMVRKMNASGVMTYAEIGDHIAGVTRERVRGLYERLCPFQYEAEKRASGE